MYKNADFSSTKNLHTLSFSLVPGQQNPASFYCVKLRKISSVTRQKGESQNGCFKKTKHAKFSKKRTFFTPSYAHLCILGGKCSFFGKFGVLCFLETPVLRFALFSYYDDFCLTFCNFHLDGIHFTFDIHDKECHY